MAAKTVSLNSVAALRCAAMAFKTIAQAGNRAGLGVTSAQCAIRARF